MKFIQYLGILYMFAAIIFICFAVNWLRDGDVVNSMIELLLSLMILINAVSFILPKSNKKDKNHENIQ